MPLKRKSISLHWEFMFTRSMYRTQAMLKQHQLLERMAELFDAGVFTTATGARLGAISAENLRRAMPWFKAALPRGRLF
jgi:hypothetical protein